MQHPNRTRRVPHDDHHFARRAQTGEALGQVVELARIESGVDRAQPFTVEDEVGREARRRATVGQECDPPVGGQRGGDRPVAQLVFSGPRVDALGVRGDEPALGVVDRDGLDSGHRAQGIHENPSDAVGCGGIQSLIVVPEAEAKLGAARDQLDPLPPTGDDLLHSLELRLGEPVELLELIGFQQPVGVGVHDGPESQHADQGYTDQSEDQLCTDVHVGP
jgi:hypothetical protein